MASDAAAFAGKTENDWQQLAGASVGRVAANDDGIPLPPISHRRNDAKPLSRIPGWRMVQRLTGNNTESTAHQAAEALAGGVDGTEIVFAGSNHPLRSRLPTASARRLAADLAALPGGEIALRLDAGAATASIAQAFAGRRNLTLTHDPVVAAAINGPTDPVGPEIAAAGRLFSAGGLRAFATADGRIWHAAGATDAQELSAVLATVVAYLRLCDLPMATAFGGVGVALAADVDLFATIAKVRAARLLLLRLAEITGASAPPQIHAETSWRMLTRRDTKMNVLRNTVAALAATVGGADSITVLPEDAVASEADAAAPRLARNTQLIIATEARLRAVADAGAGSGTIEALTDALAETAWRKFQAIEAGGGILAAIKAGTLQGEIGAARRLRNERVNRGETAILGTTAHDATAPRGTTRDGRDDRLVFARLAEPFEAEAVAP